MTRIIKIDRCAECPYSRRQNRGGHCTKVRSGDYAGRLIFDAELANPWRDWDATHRQAWEEIEPPDWCPLPKAEVGIDGWIRPVDA